jgi:hypothetical protein
MPSQFTLTLRDKCAHFAHQGKRIQTASREQVLKDAQVGVEGH